VAYVLAVTFLANALILGGYILWDGRRRGVNMLLGWVLFAALAGLLMVPFWWAFRPLRPNEVRKGGPTYVIMKNYAILWAIGGVVSMVFAFGWSLQEASTMITPAERAGGVLGGGMVSLVAGCSGIVPAVLLYLVALFAKSDKVERG
jgi:hypothetical protein